LDKIQVLWRSKQKIKDNGVTYPSKRLLSRDRKRKLQRWKREPKFPQQIIVHLEIMIRRRGPSSPRDESSSEEEEDAFAALSRKNTKRAKQDDNNQSKPPLSGQTVASPAIGHIKIDPYLKHGQPQRPQQQEQQSSSPSESRETCLVEAGADATAGTITGNNTAYSPAQLQQQPLPTASLTSSMKRHHKPSDQRKAKMDALLQELKAEKNRASPADPHRFIPEKKGSFVDQAEEHLTTNVFVGNLAPSITEEALTDLFLQFGEQHGGNGKLLFPTASCAGKTTGFLFVCCRVHR
jgi:hypothetical protein